VRRRASLALCALLGAVPAAVRCADSTVVVNSGPARLELGVTSVRAQRDAGVVKQRYDYSCGSAALATLLSYGLNDPVSEQPLLEALLAPLGPAQIVALQQNGLSLLNLQQLAQRRGHKAQGFRVHGAQLAKLMRPVIVFIKPRGYQHFAVWRGQRGDRVYLADPSLGNVSVPLYRFIDMWADETGHGVILAVERASGEWPERYALQLPAARGSEPLEALSARHLLTGGEPLPIRIPGR